ncbi:hypothetical protein BCV69DRAFT_287936 [Microstroma glucosiphilum]|uniref:Peroxisome assembly protein 12 n=1 Tax=Pseudomicrostroma glucosiphilum TaxID=1684307 RepID=A0A316U4W7_9BASI|nr:hypothetical protein BCV69DRAFT_287936 [Pseudomicrostroma glucosiphilum]PWN19373.1 hypothetical protein BCV69DRAFT_287936 [Pseudomicrostroma glucosiphilum]
MPTGDGSPSAATPFDPTRPTIFELLASDQLSSLLSPAIRYTLSVLATRQPRIFLRAFNSFEELWAVFMLLVERHYLRTWGSSFSENFYGLRRRRRMGISGIRSGQSKKGQGGLSRTEINVSLFLLVGLPYLQRKADDWWERNGGGATSDADLFGDDEAEAGQSSHGGSTWTGISSSSNVSLRDRLRALHSSLNPKAVAAYPYFKTFWSFFLLSQYVRYLFNNTPYFSPLLSLFRVEIVRASPSDYASNESTSGSLPILPPDLPNPLQRPREFLTRMLRGGPYMFFESLKYALPASIFLFKFLEWWYGSEEVGRRRDGRGGKGEGPGGDGVRFGPPRVLLPSERGILYDDEKSKSYKIPSVTVTVPPQTPPESDDGSPRSVNTQSRLLIHNSCPICGATPMNNPAVIPSGYAFCYTCINAYVEKEGRCPVSGMRLEDGESGVRRVLG